MLRCAALLSTQSRYVRLHVQAGGCAWLVFELNRRHPLRAAGAAAIADTVPHQNLGILILK